MSFQSEVAKVLDDVLKAIEVQFALIGALGEAVGPMLAEQDPDAGLRFAERFQMAADVLNAGSNDSD